MLISQMDPTLVEAVKEIIKADMQEEIERMRDSDQGCSKKCRLSIEMHKMDVERNDLLVKELIDFKWCDQCKKGTPPSMQGQQNPEKMPRCDMNCGPRIFGRLLPHMKEYGKIGQKILDIKCEIEDLNQ
jgi:hypothetical protein